MKKENLLLKSSTFYLKESKRLLSKIKKTKTVKEKIQALKELEALRNKIKFEINEITKILKDSKDSDDQDSEEWKNG